MKWFRRGTLSALIVILFPPLIAQEHTVTFTITGSVRAGLDAAGVFGPVGPLPGGPFTLVFTFDESKAENKNRDACSGPFSRLDGSGDHSPGTATLQISNTTHKFDVGPGPAFTSWAERRLEPSGFYMTIGVKSGADYISSQLRGEVQSLPTTFDPEAWDSSFPEVQLSNESTLAFMITNPATGARTMGNLAPEKATSQLPPCGSRGSGSVYPVSLHRQELLNWCWAATTQMLVENATGNTSGIYEQCRILEKFFPANDCCQRDPITRKLINTDPRTCGHNGVVHDGLDKLGFTATITGSGIKGFGTLSQDDMKQQISCKNRLVGFEWIQEATGLLHDMVVFSYQTGPKGLNFCIFDPQSAVYPHQDRFPISYKDLLDPSGSDDPRIRQFRDLRFLFYDVRPIGK